MVSGVTSSPISALTAASTRSSGCRVDGSSPAHAVFQAIAGHSGTVGVTTVMARTAAPALWASRRATSSARRDSCESSKPTPIRRSARGEPANPRGATATAHGAQCSVAAASSPARTRSAPPRREDPTTMSSAASRSAIVRRA